MALLFTLSRESKMKLIKYHSILQLVLAILILVLMAKLWFVPFKSKLDRTVWQESISAYRYKFEVDSGGWRCWNPFGVRESVGFQQYKYTSTVDRLQQALGCCGISGPQDWLQNRLALMAPSCCSDPVAFGASGSTDSTRNLLELDIPFSSSQPSSAAAPANGEPITGQQQVFHCQWFSPTGHKQGCQRLLADRETLFIFNLRLSLLFLLALLISTVLASLSLYTSLSSRQPNQVRTRTGQLDRISRNGASLAPISAGKLDRSAAQVSARNSWRSKIAMPHYSTDIRLIQAVRSHCERSRSAINRRPDSESNICRCVTNVDAQSGRSWSRQQSGTVMTII